MPLSNLNNKQKIIFISIGIVILIIILGLLGIIPGIKKQDDPRKKIQFVLNVWTINEDVNKLRDFYLNFFKKEYPKSNVVFNNFLIKNEKDYEDYENKLINSLAEGRGPDIFMIQNGTLLKHINKLAPFSKKNFNYQILDLRNNFPKVVENDFVYNNNIYGFPLSADPLVLIYNQKIFDSYAIFDFPKTWQDFLNLLTLLSKDETGRIKGAAIGLDINKYPAFSDLFLNLMLQKKVFYYSDNQLKFNENFFKETVNFYFQFTNPLSLYYTWQDNLDPLDAFKKEKIAILFGYFSLFNKEFGNNKNILITFVPQFNLDNKVSILKYYGFVVSKSSKYQSLAWEFVYRLAHNENFLNNYLKNKFPLNKKILKAKSDNVFVERMKYLILDAQSLNIFNLIKFKQDLFNNFNLLKNQELSLEEIIDIIKYRYKFK